MKHFLELNDEELEFLQSMLTVAGEGIDDDDPKLPLYETVQQKLENA